MMSGRYPETTGVWHNRADPRGRLKDVDFLPEHFMRHGYHTAGFGKLLHQPGTRALRSESTSAYGAREPSSRSRYECRC